jgi:ATP synthase F1 delta subunit
MKTSIRKYAEALAESLIGKESKADADEKIENFLKILRRNRKTKLLRRFFVVFEKVWMEKNNRLGVRAIFPSTPSDSEKSEMEKSLSDDFGKDVVLSAFVDEKMIGGLKLLFDDYVVDGSIRKNLEILKTKLINT